MVFDGNSLLESVRAGLLRLFYARGMRLVRWRVDIPFVLWDLHGSTADPCMPRDFDFPLSSWSLGVDKWVGIFDHSLRCLRSKSSVTAETMAFCEKNVPRRSPYNDDDDMPVRRPSKRPRRTEESIRGTPLQWKSFS